MTIKEIKNRLRELRFTHLCTDNKTLCAYNQIQGFLSANRTPMKAITDLYIDNDSEQTLRVVIYNDVDLESGYSVKEEDFLNSF
jgi:hypothetical protein